MTFKVEQLLNSSSSFFEIRVLIHHQLNTQCLKLLSGLCVHLFHLLIGIRILLILLFRDYILNSEILVIQEGISCFLLKRYQIRIVLNKVFIRPFEHLYMISTIFYIICLKDFQVFELLGRGGFAQVYRAKSTITGQEVAIKMVCSFLIF